MRTQRLFVALTLVNSLLLLILLGVAMAPTNPTDKVAPSVVRAQAIELVDGEGNVRGQLYLGADGGGNLRLRAPNGEVRVKLGGTNDGSGLVLMDHATEPVVQLTARDKEAAKLAIWNENGEAKVFAP